LYQFLIKKTITIKNKFYFNKKKELRLFKVTINNSKQIKNYKQRMYEKIKRQEIKKKAIFKRITILNLS
jgi:hypothetical protein